MREVPGEVLLDLVDHVQGIWLGERYVVADDVTTVVVPPAVPSEHWYDVGGCILAAFGSAERPRGVLVVRDTAGPRAWSQAESVFVQQIAGELGRAVAATEARQARTEHVSRLEELDRQKDAFLSTVSHELRTPLTSINGYLELLEDGDAGELTEEQRHMLGVIERNAVRLRGLIEDLLFLNRMRGGHDLPRERVDLDTLITQTVEEMLPVAQARGVQLQVAALGGAQTHGDRDQLARVLTNVVSNAVKFTPSGRRVRIRVAPGPGEDWVRIVCVDEGIGIPESEQAQLFTRFFRASNATRNEVPGTGLGLVVVRGIVEAHGGQLELTSTEDVGTTVTIHLPRLPAAAEGAFSSVARGLAH